MINYGDRYRARKPIRKDRVVIAVLFVVAIVLIPVLLRTGCTGPQDQPLAVVDDGTTITPADGDDVLDAFPLADGDDRDDRDDVTDTTVPTGPVAAIEDRIVQHVVADGETIADVADELGVDAANVLASNRLFGSEQLQPGEVLYGSTEGVVHTIQSGQTLTDISVTYGVPVETLVETNGITDPSSIPAGGRILVPGITSSFWADVVRLSGGQRSQFIWPLRGEVVSTFGWRVHPVLEHRHHHDGIDIDVPEGTSVHAVAGGEVYFYGEQPGYGNVLILEHPGGYYSMYGHLASAIVAAGRYVEIGQEIALSGNTGISSGPHLHLEIRNGEFPIDPLRYMP